MNDEKKTMKLPDIKMGKASIRKTLIDEKGMSYEVEEEFDVPIFRNTKKTENKEEH